MFTPSFSNFSAITNAEASTSTGLSDSNVAEAFVSNFFSASKSFLCSSVSSSLAIRSDSCCRYSSTVTPYLSLNFASYFSRSALNNSPLSLSIACILLSSNCFCVKGSPAGFFSASSAALINNSIYSSYKIDPLLIILLLVTSIKDSGKYLGFSTHLENSSKSINIPCSANVFNSVLFSIADIS